MRVIPKLIRNFLILLLLFYRGVASPKLAAASLLNVMLPDGRTTSIDVASLHLAHNHHSITISTATNLSIPLDSAWAQSVLIDLAAAFHQFKIFSSEGSLRFCADAPSLMPPIHLIFLGTLSSSQSLDVLALEHDRRGFFHSGNSGVLIQAYPWDSLQLRALVIHEAFHFWCQSYNHNPSLALLSRWQEEGFADWLAYFTTRQFPRLEVSRYLNNPTRLSLYGSSFLWWLARSESRRLSVPPLTMLAALHLGNRQDIDNSLRGGVPTSLTTHSPPTALPYGSVETTSAHNSSSHVLPFYTQPWGELVFTPPQARERPAGYFHWHGPHP